MALPRGLQFSGPPGACLQRIVPVFIFSALALTVFFPLWSVCEARSFSAAVSEQTEASKEPSDGPERTRSGERWSSLLSFFKLSASAGTEDDADRRLEGATGEQLTAWAADPAAANLSPSYPVTMETCGPNFQGRLYPLSGEHTSLPESIRPSYAAHVPDYHKSREALRKQMVDSGRYKSISILTIQWNAEFLDPKAWDFLQAVIPGNGQKVDVNSIDAVAITLQENVARSHGKHMSFRNHMADGLNALSRERTWSGENAAHVELSNIIGTKAGKAPNTQSIYLLWRNSVPVPDVSPCEWAFQKREKGFVAVSAHFEGVGRVLIVGSHLPTPNQNGKVFTQTLMKKLEEKCVPREFRGVGLNYFTAGVILLGDLNTRFSDTSALTVLREASRSEEYRDLFASPVLVPDLERAAQALLYIMDYGGPDKDERFSPLLWALDTFGGSGEIDGTENDMRSVFVDYGFEYTNACYPGSFSYSWQKSCSPPHLLEGAPRMGFACISRASRRKPAKAGFLDRVTVRPPPRASMKLRPPEGCPVADSFLTFSGQLRNLNSDHLPQAFVIQILRLRGEGSVHGVPGVQDTRL